MKYKKIASLPELRELTSHEPKEGFIQLNGCRSSKSIMYDWVTKKFHIENLVDGSTQKLTELQIMDSSITNIGRAIRLGAMFLEE